MPDTIEAFVSKLRQEGIDAGKSQAEALIDKAKAEAERLTKEAEATASATIKKAEEEADLLLAKGKADLALAVRDTIARLRSQLGTILSQVLATKTQAALDDGSVISQSVVAIVAAFADAAKSGKLQITVADAVREQVQTAVMAELGQAVEEGKVKETLIRGGYEQPGFAYVLSDGTVEVETQSVVEHLSEMVNAGLREIIDASADS